MDVYEATVAAYITDTADDDATRTMRALPDAAPVQRHLHNGAARNG
jgi:hypothetical protein